MPGITITGASGFGTASYPRGWWQTNWHFKNIFTWSRSSHLLKTGAELRQMYGSAVNTTAYIPAYNFSSILNFANDQAIQMTRYVDPRTGEPVTAYSELTQTEWAIFMSKKFTLTDRFAGEFRLDAFNALNRVNLGDPVMDLSNTSFGRSTSQLSPRALQTGVRLRF